MGAGGSNSEGEEGGGGGGPVQRTSKKKINPACHMKRLGIPKADYTPKNCFFAGLSLSENNFWDSRILHYVQVLLNYISHYKTALWKQTRVL